MNKVNVIYNFLIDYFSLSLSDVHIINKSLFKKVFRRIFFKTYILKFLQKQNENFLGFKINFFDYKDFYFLTRDIVSRLEYAIDLEKEKPIIIDCGSNIGLSILFFKYLYPTATIHGFEPDPNTYKLLEKNIMGNKIKDVIINNFALSDNNGVIDFYVDNNHPGSLIMSTIYERQPKDKIEVKCIKLSDYIIQNENNNEIDLLKIDIEGTEHQVINDLMKNNLLENINNIILEYHHNIKGNSYHLSTLLSIFEQEGFQYQISAYSPNYLKRNQYQDFMIYLYKS